MSRFFVESNQIAENLIAITGKDARHLRTVLRAKVGDEITVCDGEGFDYGCVIIDVTDKLVMAEIQDKCASYTEPKTKITLFQGLPKGDKMDLILQKCVELGVTDIFPVACSRSVSKMDKNRDERKQARWQKIAEAAAKQSGRGMVPRVGHVLSFREAVIAAKALDARIIPYENERNTTIRQFIRGFEGATIGVFIGPEGGFSPEEVRLAERSGIIPVTLGSRVLRTETAGMVAVAILLYELET